MHPINLLDIYYHSSGGALKLQIDEILAINLESSKHGMQLTHQEAQALIAGRNHSLQSHGRVELGNEVIKSIIAAFCTSPYIRLEDYAATLNELVEIFYYIKNETQDSISDAKLITIMKDLYNGSSRGSLDLLKNRDLAAFARIFRFYLGARQPY